jgi:hypothetical protein
MKIKLHIVKGGTCNYTKSYCQNSFTRWCLSKWVNRLHIGFRIIKTLKQ